MKPQGINQHHLVRHMRFSTQMINDNARNKHSITADTALRLSIVLDTSPEFWMGWLSDYDLETAAEVFGSQLRNEVKPPKPRSVINLRTRVV